MKSTKKLLLSIVSLTIVYILTALQCSPTECSTVGSKNIIYKHNYIAIAATNRQPADIEVEYYEYDKDNDINKLKTKTLKTPCIIGGEEVKVKYDISKCCFKDQLLDIFYTIDDTSNIYKQAKHIKIRNLTENELEYALITNHDTKYLESYKIGDFNFINANIIQDSTKVIDNASCYPCVPSPIYKGAPVLYLLKPELAPGAICYVKNPWHHAVVVNKVTEVQLKYPKFGNIILTRPYTEEEIIDLYKNNYTDLYATYNDYLDKINLNNANLNNANSENKIVKYYGTIGPYEIYNKINFVAIRYDQLNYIKK